MSRVIGVFSGKGGVGKTTLVANSGAALTGEFNKNVVVFDSNIHSSHLGLHLGLYEDLPVTLREVLKKRLPIMQAVYIHPATGMRIIPAPLSGDGVELTKEKCQYLVNQVKMNYDVVILDCAPGLGKEVVIPMQSIDEAIVITTADIAAVTDAMKTIELLKKFNKKILGIVVNRYKHEKYELTPEEISSTSNYNIISVIPEDSKIPESIAKGLPAVVSYPYSKSSIAFKRLAGSLINETYREPSLIGRLQSMFKLKRSVKYNTKQQIVQPVQKSSARKEISDVNEIKEELTKDIKEELKREIMKKVRAKLEERIREN